MEYERLLKLNDPLDPIIILTDKEEEHLREIPVAVIESENKLHIFNTQIDIKKRRQVPINPQININTAFNLPPNFKPEDLPQQAQLILQQMISQIAQEIQKLVQQEIVKQSPEIGFDIKMYGGKWQEYNSEEYYEDSRNKNKYKP